MTMYRRAIMPGSVQAFTKGEVTEAGVPDTMVVCNACSRIVPSRANLENGVLCPFCHNDHRTCLGQNILDDDLLSDQGEDIAVSC